MNEIDIYGINFDQFIFFSRICKNTYLFYSLQVNIELIKGPSVKTGHFIEVDLQIRSQKSRPNVTAGVTCKMFFPGLRFKYSSTSLDFSVLNRLTYFPAVFMNISEVLKLLDL